VESRWRKNKIIMKKKLKVLDLFAGVGGMSYGFEQAGLDIVGAVEFEDSIAQSMKKNHKNTKMFIADIRNLKAKKVKEEIGEIDVIIGGPPCQGFSLKGKRLGLNDKRNFLFKEYIKYIKYFNPKYFVIENVPGIISSNNGYFTKEIVNKLEKIGYKINYDILNASDFGVPQDRRRAIFMGTKMNNKILLPAKKNNQDEKITVWEAISDLAYLFSGEGEFESVYKNKSNSKYQNLMRKNSKKLFNHVATNHSDLAIDRLKRIPAEKGKEFLKEKITSTFGQTWGRLRKDKQSPTIVTRFDTPSNGKNSHPFLHRAITPREAARLQSFPDNFIFYGNKTSIIKQIGNAVPPLLGKAIAEHILKHYEKEKENKKIKNVFNIDAIELLKSFNDKQIDLFLTDIPYEHVNKKSNGLRKIDKEDANVKTFNLNIFLEEVFRTTKGSGYIFCGKEQISEIFDYFNKKKITTRLMIWEKNNPSPMNCQHTWMSGIEAFIYFKKPKATFNEYYKNSVIRFPNGSSKKHPTEKPLKLFEYLIEVSSNKGDLVCDPCVGSGTTAVASEKKSRNYIVGDISKKYYKLTLERIKNEV